MKCEHIPDKNYTHCIKCGIKVISKTFRPATEKEKEEWIKNPYKFLANMPQDTSEILELKRQLEGNKIDASHLVYMPIIPVFGIERSYVVEEWFGIKVARLISPPQD